MCPSAPRVFSEPGGQKPVLSLSLDLNNNSACVQTIMAWYYTAEKPLPEPKITQFTDAYILSVYGKPMPVASTISTWARRNWLWVVIYTYTIWVFIVIRLMVQEVFPVKCMHMSPCFNVVSPSAVGPAYVWDLNVVIRPPLPKLKGGYTGFTLSVCTSVRLSVHLSISPSVDRILSALYLQQYSLDPFHICTSYQATPEGVSRVMFVSKFKNLKFWRIL